MYNVFVIIFSILLLISCENKCDCTKSNMIHQDKVKLKNDDKDFVESLTYRHEFAILGFIKKYKEANQIDKRIPTRRIAQEQNFWTPLCFAAFIGNKPAVIELIYNGANVNYKDKNGQTPLMLAAIGENIEEIDFLLQNGADINEEDNDGSSAFVCAAAEGNLKTVEFLISKGSNTYPKKQVFNALDYAIFNEHKDVIDFLLLLGMKKSSR